MFEAGCCERVHVNSVHIIEMNYCIVIEHESEYLFHFTTAKATKEAKCTEQIAKIIYNYLKKRKSAILFWLCKVTHRS